MYGSGLGGGSARERSVKGDSNTSGTKALHAEPSWLSDKIPEGVVTLQAGSQFKNVTHFTEKDIFLQKRRLGLCRTLKGGEKTRH